MDHLIPTGRPYLARKKNKSYGFCYSSGLQSENKRKRKYEKKKKDNKRKLKDRQILGSSEKAEKPWN